MSRGDIARGSRRTGLSGQHRHTSSAAGVFLWLLHEPGLETLPFHPKHLFTPPVGRCCQLGGPCGRWRQQLRDKFGMTTACAQPGGLSCRLRSGWDTPRCRRAVC